MANDTLNCGNCGYDGGKKHLEEKLKWQEILSDAEAEDAATKQSRHVGWTATVIAAIIVGCITYGATRDEQKDPSVAKAEEVTNMYSKCLGSNQGLDDDEKKNIVKMCNEMFKKEVQELLTVPNP